MATAGDVLSAFDNIRRAQHAGVYAPHKPLLILLALGRVQRGEPRMVEFSEVDAPLRALLGEFGPSSAAKSRHYPFWHLATDGHGALWDLNGPKEVLSRPAGATPSLGELRERHIAGGFTTDIDSALRQTPGLLQDVARRMLDAYFPATLHADISAAVGLDLDQALVAKDSASLDAGGYAGSAGRRRNPGFRERVLRAYEYRCCVCGFDMRLGTIAAGLEAAHIQWHHVGGPDIESNGLALCALHHKLFDLGVFTLNAADHRIIFSQHAVSGDRGPTGEIRHHGKPILPPQHKHLLPAPHFLAWNARNVFKQPPRPIG
ncbi:MAG TPA: HNH endonuclease [Burkholderiaceae bacterium]|nr:HNH endonuclease [Burkholderiaceae bacterium]